MFPFVVAAVCSTMGALILHESDRLLKKDKYVVFLIPFTLFFGMMNLIGFHILKIKEIKLIPKSSNIRNKVYDLFIMKRPVEKDKSIS